MIVYLPQQIFLRVWKCLTISNRQNVALDFIGKMVCFMGVIAL